MQGRVGIAAVARRGAGTRVGTKCSHPLFQPTTSPLLAKTFALEAQANIQQFQSLGGVLVAVPSCLHGLELPEVHTIVAYDPLPPQTFEQVLTLVISIGQRQSGPRESVKICQTRAVPCLRRRMMITFSGSLRPILLHRL